MDYQIYIEPAVGGFIINYQVRNENGRVDYVKEIATSSVKALRIVKMALDALEVQPVTKDALLAVKPKDEPSAKAGSSAINPPLEPFDI